MMRKDCVNQINRIAEGCRGYASPRCVVIALAIVAAWQPLVACAGSIRVWSTAVVTGDQIQLGDIAELSNFDQATETRLRTAVVTEAPPAGGSRIIHFDIIRSAVSASGANMARVTLGGSTRCAVTRPADLMKQGTRTTHNASASQDSLRESPARISNAEPNDDDRTLRSFVEAYFDRELRRYNGRARVHFDTNAEQVLSLTSPTYSFEVKRRSGSSVGLTALDIDVKSAGRVVQSVPLTARVTLIRPVLVAGRSINQGATITESDIDTIPIAFDRLSDLGLEDPAQAIGLRARRFIPAGAQIDPGILESVPLVRRGQLVTMESIAGSVRVVTTAKAMDDGLRGDAIKVRSVDNRKVEYDAVVVGPGAVQVGGAPQARLVRAGGKP